MPIRPVIDETKYVVSKKYPDAIVGAAAVCYYKPIFAAWKDAQFILIRHAASGKYGSPGGLADPKDATSKSQTDLDIAHISAIRESAEELRYRGRPVLPGIKAAQLEHIDEGHYEPANMNYHPVHRHAFAYKLSMLEFMRAQRAARQKPEILKAQTGSEIIGIEIVGAGEFLHRMQDPDDGMPFTYKDTRVAIAEAARRLVARPPRPSPVFYLRRNRPHAEIGLIPPHNS